MRSATSDICFVFVFMYDTNDNLLLKTWNIYNVSYVMIRLFVYLIIILGDNWTVTIRERWKKPKGFLTVEETNWQKMKTMKRHKTQITTKKTEDWTTQTSQKLSHQEGVTNSAPQVAPVELLMTKI